MIKRLFIYITMAILFTACSTEDMALKENNMTPPAEENSNEDKTPDAEPEEMYEGICVKMQSSTLEGETEHSRSSLVFDWDKKIMVYEWDDADHIGVFALSEENKADNSKVQCMKFTPIPEQNGSDPLRRQFQGPQGVTTMPSNEYPYVAFKTADEKNYPDGSYDAPIFYTNQTQTANLDFKKRALMGKTGCTAEDKDIYNASERRASAHLSKYDFCVTAPTQAAEDKSILLNLKRISAIVKLYMRLPKEQVILDSLQVVNREKFFVIGGKLDISTVLSSGTLSIATLTNSLKEEELSHVMSLKLYTDKTPGMDFRYRNEGESNNLPLKSESTHYNGDYAFLMAYMMFWPTDLSKAEKSTLFLCGHDGENNPKYYKATLSSTPTLKPNDLFQWAPSPSTDEPITFEAITVEEWKAGTTFDNGEGGNGTGSW